MAKVIGKSKLIIILLIIFLTSMGGVGGFLLVKSNSASTNSNSEREIMVTLDPNGGEPVGLSEAYKMQDNGLITRIYSSKGNYGE